MKASSSSHPLQSIEWGEFRKKTGVKVIRSNGLQLTIHSIPYIPWTVGYFPKGPMPTKEMIDGLKEIGKKNKCIFIQLEPNIIANEDLKLKINNLKLFPAAHPLFTKYTFILDLTKSEEELLKAMHPKTRYNIRIAQKHNVQIIEDNSESAFEEYLKLTDETTKRQKFYAHTEKYHRLMWETLKCQNSNLKTQISDTDKLSAHLFLAKYNHKTLAAWILFVYKDALYYPYGSSSNENREVMASNLMMWEAIKFGKKLGLKKFDMWGALGNNSDKNDPWYGFHRFKEGYGPEHIEFAGSFDLVIDPILYGFYIVLDKLRWAYLRIKK
jgi:lipid II:glycine glycyltransferase (peptidoglycan interpeptide bridge formation enzyme)